MPIKNEGYVFTVTDSEKYSLGARDVENITDIVPTSDAYIGSFGYLCGDKTAAWVTTDSVETDYVWLALQKKDGTPFTAEELANGAEAVFTYTISNS